MKVIEKMKLSNADLEQVFRVQPVRISVSSFDEMQFDGVSTDSRTIRKGDLFFALEGENYNGHDFIKQAIAKGASGIVVSKDIPVENAPVYKVTNTLKALGNLALYYRKRFDIKCVAVTGSNGKTTTRDMLAVCLQTVFNTIKTTGNFNNLIGLPLTLFNLDEKHQVGVFELGLSVPGEMSTLAQMCLPQVGVFTNIAPVHLETLGSVEAVARAKFELVEQIPENGTVILNADDSYLSGWLKLISQKVVTYSIDNEADFKVSSYSNLPDGKTSFVIHDIEYRINFPGKHNIYNAAAAITAAVHLGCRPENPVKALNNLKPSNLRSDIFIIDEVVFIDDCYNANPVSMQKAIDVLMEYPSKGRKVAVLGDMLELGEKQNQFHIDIGQYLNKQNIDALFAYGELSQFYLEEFNTGYKEQFDDKGKLTQSLKDYLQEGDVVLIKGSRGMALEEITMAFRKEN